MATLYQSEKKSSIPCCRCGVEVVEFLIPSDIWNMVIRGGGAETDEEYLCIDCFFDALRIALGIIPSPRNGT